MKAENVSIMVCFAIRSPGVGLYQDVSFEGEITLSAGYSYATGSHMKDERFKRAFIQCFRVAIVQSSVHHEFFLIRLLPPRGLLRIFAEPRRLSLGA